MNLHTREHVSAQLHIGGCIRSAHPLALTHCNNMKPTVYRDCHNNCHATAFRINRASGVVRTVEAPHALMGHIFQPSDCSVILRHATSCCVPHSSQRKLHLSAANAVAPTTNASPRSTGTQYARRPPMPRSSLKLRAAARDVSATAAHRGEWAVGCTAVRATVRPHVATQAPRERQDVPGSAGCAETAGGAMASKRSIWCIISCARAVLEGVN